MTYVLRDRPDGQVEIILSKPILVGIFPERDVAQRVCSFLQGAEPDWTMDEPEGAGTAEPLTDHVDDEKRSADLGTHLRELIVTNRSKPRNLVSTHPTPVRNLPAVVPERPIQPPILTPVAPHLTEEQKSSAFRRIVAGEKIAAIAPEFGLTMGQLRGIWAAHKSWMQKHIQEGGQIACSLCTRPFMPSISHPDTCARCSHE